MRDGFDQFGVPALCDPVQRVHDVLGEPLGEFVTARGNLVGEVFRGGIIQTPQGTLRILCVGGRLPNGMDALGNLAGDDLTLGEVPKDVIPRTLADSGIEQGLEHLGSSLEGLDGVLDLVLGEGLGNGERMLLIDVRPSTSGSEQSVGANETHEPDVEGRTERTVKGVCNCELENEVVLFTNLNTHSLKGVDGSCLGSAPSGNVTNLIGGKIHLPEHLIGVTEEVTILEDAVVFRDDTNDLVGIDTAVAEETAGVAFGSEEFDAFDIIVPHGALVCLFAHGLGER